MSDDDWYFDLDTKEAVQGKVSGWEKRMGPYSSKSQAQEALKIAEQRNDAADAQDRNWD